MTEELFYIASLIRKHFREELTDTERASLEAWLDAAPANRTMFNEVNDAEYVSSSLKTWDKYNDDRIAAKIAEHIPSFRVEEAVNPIETHQPRVHRIHFIRTAWFRYAAAIIILFGIGAYLWNTQKEKPSVATIDPVPVQNDVAPGGNRATLTLADGSEIILDSAGNGLLAKEGEISITKKDGLIIYDAEKYPPSEGVDDRRSDESGPVYNTMTTPRGGQFQLALPDGTQVWLNAESSITYPTAFIGKERRVTVVGEAYFEVAKNAKKKFIVEVPASEYPPLSGGTGRSEGSARSARRNGGGLEIEVLGTHFNVNAYRDEKSISTTLLEGSIRLTSHDSRLTKNNSVHTTLTLKPGQQGQLNEQKQLSLAVKPDVDQAVAWKNGVLNFNNVSLEQAMRQIARWYDVEVVYEKGIPDVKFGGRLGSDLSLSQVTKALEMAGLQFKIEGKKLIVSP